MKPTTDYTANPTKLLWIDLEMTGLNPKKDVILEVAAKVTDFNFKILSSYEARVKHDKDKLVKLFDDNLWYRDQFPENRDIFLNTLNSAKSSTQIETELIEFLKRNFHDEPAILAGNSIHADRSFIKQYWPIFDTKLHYRMLDVSSWKIVMKTKFNVEFEKQSNHRALEDIQESINELKFYLKWFNSQKTKS
jgi:oligoribonuclease